MIHLYEFYELVQHKVCVGGFSYTVKLPYCRWLKCWFGNESNKSINIRTIKLASLLRLILVNTKYSINSIYPLDNIAVTVRGKKV